MQIRTTYAAHDCRFALPVRPETLNQLPVKAANKKSPDAYHRYRGLAFRTSRSDEDFGAETSVTPCTVSPFSSESRLSKRDRRFLRASTARFVEPCDSPHVSVRDAFDSVIASRQRTTSTHASVGSRFGQETCASCQIEGSCVSRRFRPALVGLWSLLFYQFERFLLEPMPRGRTSNTSVAS